MAMIIFSWASYNIIWPGSVSNVLSFVAEKTGYKNVKVPANQIPQLNLTGVAPGALSSGDVLTRPGPNEKLPPAPPPVNMLLMNKATPWQMSPETVDGKHIIPCA
ncbi:hypothetical protein B0H13DRAFT_2313302 [Mycena leptocephala]|nr:hypothetical protein B0H13DRAFT_2313302 [Mycena leptocephala]